jgi:hypothetical protein
MIKWIKKVIAWIKWVTVRNKNRQYQVVRCPFMPSAVGMILVGKPSENTTVNVYGRRADGYRQLYVSRVRKMKRGNLDIFTPNGYVFVKRVK